mmetsp:Transcript_14852/g.17994  ORF Transcript_14852/g.17994 Transcript_14852/m.17994 type:complete len:148 (+) Transcript_14852:71-514(+)
MKNKPNQDSISRCRNGRWLQLEHDIFEREFATYGKNWKKISDTLQTRSAVQVRTHARNWLAKTKLIATIAEAEQCINEYSSSIVLGMVSPRSVYYFYPCHDNLSPKIPNATVLEDSQLEVWIDSNKDKIQEVDFDKVDLSCKSVYIC